MNPIETVVVSLLSCLVLIFIIWGHLRSPNWRSFILNLLGLSLYVLLLHAFFGFPVPRETIAKAEGPARSTFLAMALAMFLCMVLGMAAESLYHYLDAPPGKRQFDIGTFVKPFLISPLVFMPLAASLANANLDLSQFDAPRLMVFLVAFENGFLWRGYFSRKLAESAVKNERAA